MHRALRMLGMSIAAIMFCSAALALPNGGREAPPPKQPITGGTTTPPKTSPGDPFAGKRHCHSDYVYCKKATPNDKAAIAVCLTQHGC